MDSVKGRVGVFDSGVGGLSVLRAMRELMPEEPVLYFADQAHVPYGSRSLEQVREFSLGITRFLLERQAKLIVVACNTASAAALHFLRDRFPKISFVGMEPAVKPAVEKTQSGRVGVLATPATFHGTLYASLLERFAREVQIFQDTCPGLVAQIEKGDLEGAATRSILEAALTPMLRQGIDTVVLGCTHYPFVIPLIEKLVDENVRVIDPAPAVAMQANRVLKSNGSKRPPGRSAKIHYYTTGDANTLSRLLPLLMGKKGNVQAVGWAKNGELIEDRAG